MPAPPPPIQKSNAPVDTIDVPDVDVDFEEERGDSHSRPIAATPRPEAARPAAAAPEAPRPSGVRIDAQSSKPPPPKPSQPRMPAVAPPPHEPKPTPSLEGVTAPVSAGPSSRSETYSAGDVIASKYRLKSIIGRGGMGAVWLAHNIALDIDVAIKLIRRDRAARVASDRLLNEARAAARLRHPVIVRVFDIAETERGDPFIVMELLHGEALSAVIARKGRLQPAVAVQTLLPVASALVEAHAKGIVHRDLKPDNILLVTDESGAVTPKVVDFGIAKLMDNDIDRQLTMAGEVLGSPDYMSPEQARGDVDVGEGTDVWALSVVLYEAITGRRPFDGPNYNALIAAILTLNPPPASEFSDCDGELWAILAKGLAKENAQRWQTIRELGTALALWVESRGIEDDITGTSIAKQWTLNKSRRLFTVFPEGEPPPMPARSSIEPPAPSGRASGPMAGQDRLSFPDRPSLPSWSAAPIPPSVPGPAPEEWANNPPFRRSRVPLVVLTAVIALGVIGYFAVSMISPSNPVAGAALSASASAAPTAPSATTPQLPSASASAPDPTASTLKSAAPWGSSSAKPGASTKPVRPKPAAPQVPKHINF